MTCNVQRPLVALRLLHPEKLLASDPNTRRHFADRFLAESRLMAALVPHTNIAGYYGVGVHRTPDREHLEIPFQVLEYIEGVSAEALIEWARESMSSYKAPREVRFIDALPATGAGKVLRRLLKDPA